MTNPPDIEPETTATVVPRQLNLGCGRDKKPDCMNVDANPTVEPDLLWNLEERPFPLPRHHFEIIYANDVVEHLEDLIGFMSEVHALLAPGGRVIITTPHFSCSNSFTDPTHRHHLSYFSFDYFTNDSPWSFYSEERFEIAERLIVFHNTRFSRFVARWANRHPALYERRFTWLYPAWFLIFELVALKDGSG